MSDKLKRLPEDQKKAVVALSCMVSAQANEGIFRTNDHDVDVIARACFDDGWMGFADMFYRHSYFYGAATSDIEACKETVKALDMETKYAFKNLLIDIIGNNAMKMIAASFILKDIGMTAFQPPKPQGADRVARNTQEDDGEPEATDAHYAWLFDVNAVRGKYAKEFTLIDQDTNESTKVIAGYDGWKQSGVCPTNGLVGYYLDSQSVRSEEGTVCYFVTGGMVVPVLKWGLQVIDEWVYREKSHNNRMLRVDKSGKRCEELRLMKKASSPTKPSPITKSEDKKVVHFMGRVQQRFEPGKFFPPNYIDRQIHLTYTKFGSELELEVLGVMMPRHARFEKDDGYTITYKDINNGAAYYEVETEKEHNTIVRVSIFQITPAGYYVEYRYTTE